MNSMLVVVVVVVGHCRALIEVNSWLLMHDCLPQSSDITEISLEQNSNQTCGMQMYCQPPRVFVLYLLPIQYQFEA